MKTPFRAIHNCHWLSTFVIFATFLSAIDPCGVIAQTPKPKKAKPKLESKEVPEVLENEAEAEQEQNVTQPIANHFFVKVDGKMVRVTCEVSPRHVRLQVTDEGPGFKPETVPDCTREDRLDMPGGRGLLLMRSFMTTIEYNDRGNSVLLEKDLDAPPASPDDDDADEAVQDSADTNAEGSA